MNKISIRDLEKSAVLAALFNASKPLGAGFIQYDPTPMTKETAQAILNAGHTDFDYLQGRVMKVNLSGDEFSPWGYDRDNGEGAAQRAIDTLRASGDVNNPVIDGVHKTGTKVSALNTKAQLGDKTRVEDHGGIGVMRLGLNDLAEHLGPRVDKVLKK